MVCEGTKYSYSNLAPKETVDGKTTKTYFVSGDTIKEMNCPVSGKMRIFCTLTVQIPDGAYSTKVDWSVDVDRVSGSIEEHIASTSIGAAVISRAPEARQFLAPNDTLTTWNIFRGNCKKVNKNKL